MVIAMAISCQNSKQDKSYFIDKALVIANKQLENAVDQNLNKTKFPRSASSKGKLRAPGSADWVSGFFPGSLWYMYEFSNDEKFKKAAQDWTKSMEVEQYNTSTHDVGFMIYCCYGNGYRLTNNKEYEKVIVQAAKSLISRFNPKVGCIKSWDWSTKWSYPVIIDNMMNLELLYAASKITNNSIYKEIANKHALTTMKNHFRADYSSYHVVDYSTETGNVVAQETHQGYANESAWARGQAWALYGYTMCYRETGNEVFLNQAVKVADFVMNHPNVPDDLIPYWDYDAPNIPNEPRDASTAALFASALLQLSTLTTSNSEEYFLYAENILNSLSSPEYLAEPGTNSNFILKHSTGSKPENSEIDEPLAYADYYFLEALLRYQKLTSN